MSFASCSTPSSNCSPHFIYYAEQLEDLFRGSLGTTAAETWFLGELDSLLTRYVDQKKVKLGSPYTLIQAIFSAAFKHKKTLEAIKVQIIRIRKGKKPGTVK